MAKGLGRGLGSLLDSGGVGNSAETENGVVELELVKIRPNPDQPRREFPEESLQELSDSIRANGVIQPILVEPIGENGFYTIIAGERRFRAAGLADLVRIPTIIRTYSEQERMRVALIENLQREDLTPLEEARAYHQLMERFGLSQEEMAKAIGKSRSAIANTLRLLRLPDSVQASLAAGKISAGHARAILSQNNEMEQNELFQAILTQSLTVREAENWKPTNSIQEFSKKKVPKNHTKQVDPDFEQVAQKLIEVLGTRVTVKGSPLDGAIEIRYYSPEDLERLIEIICGKRLTES